MNEDDCIDYLCIIIYMNKISLFDKHCTYLTQLFISRAFNSCPCTHLPSATKPLTAKCHDTYSMLFCPNTVLHCPCEIDPYHPMCMTFVGPFHDMMRSLFVHAVETVAHYLLLQRDELTFLITLLSLLDC